MNGKYILTDCIESGSCVGCFFNAHSENRGCSAIGMKDIPDCYGNDEGSKIVVLNPEYKEPEKIQMKIEEKVCLVVPKNILRNVFGENYWNDNEDIRCVPADRITEEEMVMLEKELGGDFNRNGDYSFLIGG